MEKTTTYMNKYQPAGKKEKLMAEYAELLQKPDWRFKREIIMKRDGHCCNNCGSANNLQVHHRQYHKNTRTGEYKNPWDYKDHYLVTLCFDCHKAGHIYFKIPVFNV